MARFTHLARAKDEASIRRGGITLTRVTDGLSGVYSMPRYFASHQCCENFVGSAPHSAPRPNTDPKDLQNAGLAEARYAELTSNWQTHTLRA